ncbi:hypothetical protein IMG5_174450 [Ichthyophthirius multifiliis]|uniref:Cyclic nucleotide-binding domain-containing protein n=1 Tax=Ichthyophthirius multifiliis TaxID=5932 RepID=G0R227_ICHMU|nr:hypothetical protein IMG5_174450 [Ichthyophthirius multifiliis]EGR28491.1 hypothetical protein IMG5_174450 [Ichthyophthirius multifiliis]|eukprot:XP_004029727.1 hypothetical protein IMG5_174450 [Ichthyophthirius multifiliis]
MLIEGKSIIFQQIKYKKSQKNIEQLQVINEQQNLNDSINEELKFLNENYQGFILVKIFNPGESFGEIALITSQGRTATLVAKEESHVMVLNKVSFEKVMGYVKKNVWRDNLDFLTSFSFFQNTSTRKLYQILHQMKVINLKIKEPLYIEGDPSNFFYLIKEGEIEIQQQIQEIEQLTQEYNEIQNNLLDSCQEQLEKLRNKKKALTVRYDIVQKLLDKVVILEMKKLYKKYQKDYIKQFVIVKKLSYIVLNKQMYATFQVILSLISLKIKLILKKI